MSMDALRDEEMEFEVTVVQQETEKAWLCDIDGEDIWLPKSQVMAGAEDLEVDACNVVITIPGWLAMEKGLY
jgi:hypothetical protein